MSFTKSKREQIKQYILGKIDEGDTDFVHATTDAYAVSLNTVYRYLAEMEEEGLIEKKGRKYHLTNQKTTNIINRTENTILREDVLYKDLIEPLAIDLPENVQRIWQYGFMEMMNNAIDHSEADHITVSTLQNRVYTVITISDDGVGIFKKIQDCLKFDTLDDAVIELFKGKLTTDRAHHSGEGIFFTSRVMDMFCACANGKEYSYSRYPDEGKGEDFHDITNGTLIYMRLSNSSNKNLKDVFDQYADSEGGFTKTSIPIKNMFDIDPVSRSQAKRLCQRLDQFRDVELDFENIEEIGQGFAHELFVVFQNEHPKINLIVSNASENVKKMINHVKI